MTPIPNLNTMESHLITMEVDLVARLRTTLKTMKPGRSADDMAEFKELVVQLEVTQKHLKNVRAERGDVVRAAIDRAYGFGARNGQNREICGDKRLNVPTPPATPGSVVQALDMTAQEASDASSKEGHTLAARPCLQSLIKEPIECVKCGTRTGWYPSTGVNQLCTTCDGGHVITNAIECMNRSQESGPNASTSRSETRRTSQSQHTHTGQASTTGDPLSTTRSLASTSQAAHKSATKVLPPLPIYNTHPSPPPQSNRKEKASEATRPSSTPTAQPNALRHLDPINHPRALPDSRCTSALVPRKRQAFESPLSMEKEALYWNTFPAGPRGVGLSEYDNHSHGEKRLKLTSRDSAFDDDGSSSSDSDGYDGDDDKDADEGAICVKEFRGCCIL